MAMDALDYATVIGLAALVIATRYLEGLLLAAGLGGFALSLSMWRLAAGRVWEALGWLAWVGTAALLVVGPDGNPLVLTAFFVSLLIGVGLLFGGRLNLLPDIWTQDVELTE